MTRTRDTSTEYREGLSLGALYAEADIRSYRNEEEELRAEAQAARSSSRAWRAFRLGIVRGYRNQRARYDAGELSWEMFEQAPVNR